MSGLSKSRIVIHQQCPKRLWLQTYRPEQAEVEDSAQVRMEAGHQVGDIARRLFPGGMLIDTPDLTQALLETSNLLAGPPRPLFEATFQAEGVLVRADLLIPDGSGYRMVEVKSATSVKDYYYADAAIQAWVAQRAGVPLSRIEVAHIDTGFVYPGGEEYQGLLRHVDVTDAIAERIAAVPAWIQAARTTLDDAEPAIEPGKQCHDPYDCPFIGYCSPPVEGYPPELLPNNRGLAARLRSDGYTDLRDVPEHLLSNDTHRRIWRITRSGVPELDPRAGAELRKLPYPRYYLDFETLNPAVPIWPGTRPYMQVPFQWSCHIEHADGHLEHHAYLADDQHDPRPGFIDSLLDVLGSDGPIFVYNIGFERGRLNELKDGFKYLSPRIESVIDRLVDLYPIAKANYYHPAMRGSWSIKSVLPTIDAGLSYEGMTVADGGMAQAAFTELIEAATPEQRRAELRNALLAYCERDTMAMVRLARHFQS